MTAKKSVAAGAATEPVSSALSSPQPSSPSPATAPPLSPSPSADSYPSPELLNLKLPKNPKVSNIKCSPDGQLCAVVNEEKVYIYNFESKKIVSTLTHPKKINCLSFDTTKFLATGCEDGIVRIWNLDKCQQGFIGNMFSSNQCENTISIEKEKNPIKSLSYNNDGSYLAIGSDSGAYIFVVNTIKKTKLTKSFRIKDSQDVSYVSFKEKNVLAIGLNTGEIKLCTFEITDTGMNITDTIKISSIKQLIKFIKFIDKTNFICTDESNIYIFNNNELTVTIPGKFRALSLNYDNQHIYYENNDGSYMFYYLNAKTFYTNNIIAEYADFKSNNDLIIYHSKDGKYGNLCIYNKPYAIKVNSPVPGPQAQGPQGQNIAQNMAKNMANIVGQSSLQEPKYPQVLQTLAASPASQAQAQAQEQAQIYPPVQVQGQGQGNNNLLNRTGPGQGQEESQIYPPVQGQALESESPKFSSNIEMNPGSIQKDIKKLDDLKNSLDILGNFINRLKEKHQDIITNVLNNIFKNLDGNKPQTGGTLDAITQASNERAITKKSIKTIDQIRLLVQENFNLNKRFFLEDNKSLIREFLKVKERINTQNSSGISSTGEMNKLIALIEKTKDQNLINQVKGTKDTIINNLKANLSSLKQEDKYAILNQISVYDYASRASDQILQKLTDVDNAFDAKILEISKVNYDFAENLKTNLKNRITIVDIKDDEYIKKIQTAKKDFEEETDQKTKKLKSLYMLNYSIMDLTMDSQFYVLYVIKGLRILFAYISLFLATRIFTPMYESTVYDKQKNPPSLEWYTMIYLSLDAAFNVFLFVLLYLIRALFSSTGGDFVIDSYLFKKYITDYLISTFLLMAISNLIAVVITKKKYFRYQYEGSRTIRAFEQIMFFIAIILYLFPFFWVL